MRKKVALLVESSRAYGRGTLGRNCRLRAGPSQLVDLPPRADARRRRAQVARVVAGRRHHRPRRKQADRLVPAKPLNSGRRPARAARAAAACPVLETNDVAVDAIGVRAPGGARVSAVRVLRLSGRQLLTPAARHSGEDARSRLARRWQRSTDPIRTRPTPPASRPAACCTRTSWPSGSASLEKPVGVIACNDTRAVQLLNAARECEIEVPDEVAVVGVDNDMLLCDLADPPLSSVEHNTRRIGYEAATLLDRMMRGQAPPEEPMLINPLHVVVRQSSDVTAIRDAGGGGGRAVHPRARSRGDHRRPRRGRRCPLAAARWSGGSCAAWAGRSSRRSIASAFGESRTCSPTPTTSCRRLPTRWASPTPST